MGWQLPGDCAKAIDENPVKFSNFSSESPATSTAMQKLKTAATSFLTSGGVKRFGIAGAAGAVGAALVKEFRNDDPTTYLSNEDQQKSMLVDMATQPITTDFDRPAYFRLSITSYGCNDCRYYSIVSTINNQSK